MATQETLMILILDQAFNFLCKIVSESEKRDANSMETVQKIAFAKLVKLVDMKLRPSFATFPNNIFKTDEAEQEYRNLVNYKWTDKCDLSTIKPAEFRNFVHQNEKFRNLGAYMLSLMLLPLSNASTERICGSLKTKSRNRMIVTTLDALLSFKTTFLNQNGPYALF